MQPIYYREIIYMISIRLQMILSKNLKLTSLAFNINSLKTKIKIFLHFNYNNKEFEYHNIIYISKDNDLNILVEDTIDNILKDIENKFEFLKF